MTLFTLHGNMDDTEELYTAQTDVLFVLYV